MMNKLKLLALAVVMVFSFQGMAQNKIDTFEIAVMKNVQFIFPDQIIENSIEFGSLAIEYKLDRNQLLVFSKQQNFFTTNMILQTLGDKKRYYMFILTYNENPKSLFNVVKNSWSIHEEEVQELREEVPDQRYPLSSEKESIREVKGVTKNEPAKPLTLEGMAQKVETLKSTHSSIGLKENRMLLYIDAIYIKGDQLFIRTNLLNESAVRYDIDLVNISVIGKQGGKKRVTDVNPSLDILFPSVTDIEVSIGENETYSRVFVIDKITFNKKEMLHLEFRERNGDRNIEVSISSDDILTAQTF
jgi:hypothetical protein